MHCIVLYCIDSHANLLFRIVCYNGIDRYLYDIVREYATPHSNSNDDDDHGDDDGDDAAVDDDNDNNNNNHQDNSNVDHDKTEWSSIYQ